MIKIISSISEFDKAVNESQASLMYFSHEKCNVCKVLKPKVEELIINYYPEIDIYYIDTLKSPEISGQHRIFSIPTILVYFDKYELFRKSRSIGIEELRRAIDRPYSIFFD